MRSTNIIDEYDPEEIEIKRTGEITNLAFAGVEVRGTPGNICTYQTGRFPLTFIKGTKYVFMLYCYESNTIIP